MNIHHNPTEDSRRQDRDARGFTLIEILIAIVLVGILAAVAVVGISNLVGKGTKSACQASADSAKAASAVYFSDQSAYPTTLAQLTAAGANGAPLTLPTGVVLNTATVTSTASVPAAAIGQQASGAGWLLTMTAGVSGGAPTFACN